MEQDVYKSRLKEAYDLTVLISSDVDRGIIYSIIGKELCLGALSQLQKLNTYVLLKL
jgi:aspartate/glutamate racemase